MDYEKAYKEAIESIKRIYDQADSYGKELMEKEFPELAESEDEKIKREIVKFLKENKDFPEDWIAWLEKQGEQNSADPFLNWLEKQGERNNIVEQLTAFAIHPQKRGAFCDDLCMDFEHEAQSFIEMQRPTEL